MATTPPMPNPQQAAGPGAPPPGGPDPSGGQPGAPSQAPAPPELMMLSQIMQAMKQVASMNPATSAGLAKAVAGVNQAMSDVVTSNPSPSQPSQTPPY